MKPVTAALLALVGCGGCGGKKSEEAAKPQALAAAEAVKPAAPAEPAAPATRKIVPASMMKDLAKLTAGAEVEKGWKIGEPRHLLDGERIDVPIEGKGGTIVLMMVHLDKGQGIDNSKNFAIRLGSQGVEWGVAYKVALKVIETIKKNDTADVWTDAPAAAPFVPPAPAPPAAAPAESSPE